MKERSHNIMWGITGILIAVSAAVLYKTHRAVPFMMDDLWYSTMLSEDTPITSLSDIVKSQIWHYQNWGGRSMTHGILQLTLLVGERGADIMNVIVTLLLSAVICAVARFRKLPAFWAALSMLLGLNANWKMSMFWQAGAANYLYITVPVLVFAHCYLRELPDEKNLAQAMPKRLRGITLWILPAGLLAGWSNENIGPAIWFLSLAVMILLKREKKKLPLWMVLGNICCLAGSVFMIAAPGNFVRSAQVESGQYGALWQCFLRMYAESAAVTQHLFPALLVLGFLLILCKGVLGEKIGRKNGLLLLCALLSWGAMVLSPHYPDRATFGTMALLICAAVSLAEKILVRRKDLAWMFWGMTGLIWLRGMFFCGEFLAITWGWIR